MLDYENQMFLEILQDDGLVVCAKGLGLETVFANILKVYSDPGNLVLVLGTNENDEKYLLEQLAKDSVTKLPQVINAQNLSEERINTYLEGGVFFVSGRILVVDLLKNRVPLELVTGILVYRAHSILNSYQEAFALRLYRQKNKTGFIKAFSNSALAFMSGFSQVEKVMRSLYVTKLFLWPRFHSIVNNNLSANKPEVIELHAKLSPTMVKIQTALLDVINILVKDLKRLNKTLDLEELTVENVVAKKFHKHLQHQLDPIWDQLSFKTKQLISDMKTIRYLLMCLTNQDAVTFYDKLNNLRTVEYAMKSSGWMMLDIVDDVFKYARSRIYNEKNEITPELNPKWTALLEILTEIHRNISKDGSSDQAQKVLILTQDSSTCNQLKNILTIGGETHLKHEVEKKLGKKAVPVMNKILEKDSEKSDSSPKDDVLLREEMDLSEFDEEQESYVLTLSQPVSQHLQEQESCPGSQTFYEDCSQMENMDLTMLAATAPVLVIQSLKKHGDPMSLQRSLYELKPKYIVMYVADITAVRQLEVYQNNNPTEDLKIYFLIYGGSVEEQAYLTSLRREKEAFDLLINTKATMVIPVEQDGKTDIPLQQIEQVQNDPQSTRKGDVQEKVTPKIVVDMREFRSELPSLLHKRGIEIEPITITIGDYILSPEICVERKSISDLIGSLNSGRLYNQAVAMTRYYAKPILLIEFDENKPFSLQSNYYISKDLRSIDITTKLQLLTMHFPKLRIVWSPSPTATAQLFEELKHGRAQPDGAVCAQIGASEDPTENQITSEKYNTNIQDFIIKLPGVNSKNLRVILNKGVSLDNLIKMTQEEINTLLGNKNDSKSLYEALHKKLKDAQESNTSGKNFPKTRPKRQFFGKKASK